MGGLMGARRLHNCLLQRILSLRMAWFDIVPFGRLSNRFSKDVEVQTPADSLALTEEAPHSVQVARLPLIQGSWVPIPWWSADSRCTIFVS